MKKFNQLVLGYFFPFLVCFFKNRGHHNNLLSNFSDLQFEEFLGTLRMHRTATAVSTFDICDLTSFFVQQTQKE